MILESYNIEVINVDTIDYAWMNEYCRIGKDWVQFFPDKKKPFSTGSYLCCKNGMMSKMQYGKFTKAGKYLFLQGDKENFYA